MSLRQCGCGVAGRLERRTCTRRPRVPPYPLTGFVHGSLEFKSSAMLVNSQLVCLRPVGILKPAMLDFIIMNFMCLLGAAGINAINTTEELNNRIFFTLSFFLRSA